MTDRQNLFQIKSKGGQLRVLHRHN